VLDQQAPAEHGPGVAFFRELVAKRVMDDPTHGLPSDTMAFELLRQQRLLPYPNENPWYYPHPLLTLSLLKPAPGSAS